MCFMLTVPSFSIMRPGTPHAVITVKDCLSVGGHFYSTATYELSAKSWMHEYYIHPYITNSEHPSALIFGLKTLEYFKTWIDSFSDDSWKNKFPPRFNMQRLAGLIVFLYYASELPPRLLRVPDSEKTEEAKWFHSHNFNHDIWRMWGLFSYIMKKYGSSLSVEIGAVEQLFLKRGRLTREAMGTAIRGKSIEATVKPLIDLDDSPDQTPVPIDVDTPDSYGFAHQVADSMDVDEAHIQRSNLIYGSSSEEEGDGDDSGDDSGDSDSGEEDEDEDEDQIEEEEDPEVQKVIKGQLSNFNI